MNKWLTECVLGLLCVLYLFLQGFNLSYFTLWSLMALLLILGISAYLTLTNKPKTPAFWGFVIGCNVFMLPVHLLWFFDIADTRTGDSSSSLVFTVMPVWSFLSGCIGSGIGRVLRILNDRKHAAGN